MRTITIAARKGGVGKTTLAVHLSVLAAREGKPVLLVDVDPQRSLAWWWRLREGETPALVECDAKDLSKIVPTAKREGVETVIIDTAPHDRQGIVDAVRVADLVLMPTRPGAFDLAALGATLEIVGQVGNPHLAILNACPPRTGSAEPSIVSDARAALVGMGATVAGSVVSQRVALGHAIMTGQTVGEYEPDGRAAGEIAAAWVEIQSYLERKQS